jgi:hypothetical protein
MLFGFASFGHIGVTNEHGMPDINNQTNAVTPDALSCLVNLRSNIPQIKNQAIAISSIDQSFQKNSCRTSNDCNSDIYENKYARATIRLCGAEYFVISPEES